MRFFYCLFILLFLNGNTLFAQNNLSNKQIDSLIKVNAPFIYENPESSYKLAKITHEASVKNNYDLGAAISLRKISLYYSEIHKDYHKALYYNDEGFAHAKKIKNDSLILFFNFDKGALYGKLGFRKRGIEILDECLSKTHLIKNDKKRSLMTGDLYTHKALFLSDMNPPEVQEKVLYNYIQAMHSYEQALDKCLDVGYTNVGYCYSKMGNYDQAAYYFNKAIAFFKLKNILTCEIEYTNLAQLYLKKGEYEKSLKYADSSNAICLKTKPRNYSLIYQNYKNYREVYQKLNRSDVVTKYYNLELLYKDSLNLQKENQLEQSARYIIGKNELENSTLQKNNYYLFFGFGTLLALIGIGVYAYYHIKNRQHTKQTLLQQEKLEIKTSEVEELKHKVSNSYNDLTELAKNNDPLFTSFFIELYPEFYKKLKEIQPDLTLVEQKVCFYLKLKFTTKEIAAYTFVSVKAIQNRKNRLRKRLFIDNDTDIYDWMDRI